MSERVAPSIAELAGIGMITLRGDLTDPDFAKAAQLATGLAVPSMRQVTGDAARALAWMSPDEALLICPVSEAADLLSTLEGAFTDQFATIVDVSDARTMFEVAGPGAREALAKLTPADMHPESFAPGEMRRTRLAQVATALWMPGPERIHLICFRSVAQYVADLLALSTAPAGALELFPAVTGGPASG